MIPFYLIPQPILIFPPIGSILHLHILKLFLLMFLNHLFYLHYLSLHLLTLHLLELHLELDIHLLTYKIIKHIILPVNILYLLIILIPIYLTLILCFLCLLPATLNQKLILRPSSMIVGSKLCKMKSLLLNKLALGKLLIYLQQSNL